MKQNQIIPLVLGCNVEFEASPYSAAGGDYTHLCYLANIGNTADRVEIAQALILYGNDEVRTSRAMDNCFENGDGDQVRAELEMRALTNMKLARAMRGVFA
jgi:hypothetical protein